MFSFDINRIWRLSIDFVARLLGNPGIVFFVTHHGLANRFFHSHWTKPVGYDWRIRLEASKGIAIIVGNSPDDLGGGRGMEFLLDEFYGSHASTLFIAALVRFWQFWVVHIFLGQDDRTIAGKNHAVVGNWCEPVNSVRYECRYPVGSKIRG